MPKGDAENEAKPTGIGEDPGKVQLGAKAQDGAYAIKVIEIKNAENLKVALSQDAHGAQEQAQAAKTVKPVPLPGGGTTRTASESGLYSGAGVGEAKADAHGDVYAFRAGSSLPEDKIVELSPRVCILRYKNELYGVPAEALDAAFGSRYFKAPTTDGSSIDLGDKVKVLSAVTQGAAPELIRSVGTFNIVHYDGLFYVVPQHLGQVMWGQVDVASLPGVETTRTLREAFATAERRLGGGHADRTAVKKEKGELAEPSGGSVPRLVGSLEGYNIVEFEGWFYGLLQSLGDIDLSAVDVIEMPGVIRDLSKTAVEGEIREIAKSQRPLA